LIANDKRPNRLNTLESGDFGDSIEPSLVLTGEQRLTTAVIGGFVLMAV
jgi:hypothetical protein